jgi:GT2 family glycosyltransferase
MPIEVKVVEGQPVDSNRNRIVKEFLEDPDNEWLFFIDDDMLPKNNVLGMIDFNKPIQQAVTTVMQKRLPQPLIRKFAPGTDELMWRMIEPEDINQRDDELIPVDGIGTGCVLIHRSVLEKIKPPWFEFKRDEYGIAIMSEDYVFSKKATEAGFEMFCNTAFNVGHLHLVDLYAMNRTLADVSR